MPTLGERLSQGVRWLGQKIKTGYDIGRKAITNTVRTVAKATGLDKLGGWIANAIDSVERAVFSMFPSPVNKILENLYNATPVGRVVNMIQYSGDVASGKQLLDLTAIKAAFGSGLISSIISAIQGVNGIPKQYKDVAIKAVRQVAGMIIMAHKQK